MRKITVCLHEGKVWLSDELGHLPEFLLADEERASLPGLIETEKARQMEIAAKAKLLRDKEKTIILFVELAKVAQNPGSIGTNELMMSECIHSLLDTVTGETWQVMERKVRAFLGGKK